MAWALWLAPLFAQSDSTLSGVAAYARGEYPAAEKVLSQRPGDPQAQLFLALTFAATNRCDQAIPKLEHAFAGTSTPDPEARLAGLAIVQCLITQSKFDDATPVLARLKVRFPGDADVLYLAARLHMRAWNETLYQLYKAAPGSYRVNEISGEILETQSQFAAAAEEFRKALKKNPEAVNLHFRLGRALLMSSHSPETLEAARQEFEAELRHNPRDAAAHYQVAQILLAQDHPQQAELRLEDALRMDDRFPEALIALGKLRLTAKRADDAIGLFKRAAEIQPGSETVHYNLMLAYRNAGRLEDARHEKELLDAIQKPPEGEFTGFLKKLGEKPPPAK